MIFQLTLRLRTPIKIQSLPVVLVRTQVNTQKQSQLSLCHFWLISKTFRDGRNDVLNIYSIVNNYSFVRYQHFI